MASASAHQLRKGEPALLLGSANRDPGYFDRPDVLHVCQSNNRHVAFSQSVHFCLEAGLARLEGQMRSRRVPIVRSLTPG